MSNSFKIRYLTNREKVNSFEKLHKDRHLYLGLTEAEPNLGYVGEKELPTGISTFYSLVTIANGTVYDRYWKEIGLRIEDEGTQVGVGNNINIINFVGAAITVTETSSNSVDVKVFAPGLDNQIIYNNNDEFTAASQFYYNSSTNKVGIGSQIPQQELDIIGSLKISNNIYDSLNTVGAAGSVLISTAGNGVIWSRGAPVSIGTIPHSNAIAGELWWNKRTGNLNVYYDDGNSQQWVDANSGMGIQGLQGVQGPVGGEPNYWQFGELGISTTKNVGIGTTNPTSKLSVIGNVYISGVVTATSFSGITTSMVTGLSTVSSTGSYNDLTNRPSLNGPAFYAYADPGVTAQTITSGSQQKVTFGAELFDTDNCFANSRFTPNVAGYYQLNSTVRLDTNTGTGELMIVIWKNGSEYSRGWNNSGVQLSDASGWFSMSVSTIAYANGSTDYFEVYVQQTAGADKTITRYSNITWFNGCMIRGA